MSSQSNKDATPTVIRAAQQSCNHRATGTEGSRFGATFGVYNPLTEKGFKLVVIESKNRETKVNTQEGQIEPKKVAFRGILMHQVFIEVVSFFGI